MTSRIALASSCFLFACGGATPAPEPASSSADGPSTYAIALHFGDGGTDESETPHTMVSLVRIAPDGERHVLDLHDEIGACYLEPASGALLAGRCWWGGAGARYEVRREGDAVVAYRADVDEMADEPAEFVEAGRIEVAEDADLEVLAPGRRSAAPE